MAWKVSIYASWKTDPALKNLVEKLVKDIFFEINTP